MTSVVTNEFKRLLVDPLAFAGYGVVFMDYVARARKVLRIDVCRYDALPISVDDCAAATGIVKSVLGNYDPREGDDYSIEVGSPEQLSMCEDPLFLASHKGSFAVFRFTDEFALRDCLGKCMIEEVYDDRIVLRPDAGRYGGQSVAIDNSMFVCAYLVC